MKLSTSTLTLLLGISLAFSPANAQAPAASPAAAAVPRLINFSAKVADAQGKPAPGVAGVTFSIYRDQYEGAPLWMETQNVQADSKGNYTVQLGANSPQGIPLELFMAGEARWLGVRVNGREEQARTLLLSVPYALKAADAETLGGKPLSAFMMTSQSGTAQSQPGQAQQDQARNQAQGQGQQASYPIKCSSATACQQTFIPIFSTSGGAAKVAASILSQSGTTVSAAGALTATGAVTASSFAIGTNPFAFGNYSTQNVFLGFAGNSTTSGATNTGVGSSALFNNTSGASNTATGGFALFRNNSGHDNTANGAGALYNNQSGVFNTADGSAALFNNTNGQNNTAGGWDALYHNSSGAGNTATGAQALTSNQSGGENTAVGYQALFGNTTGSSNTGVGNDAAGSNATGQFNTAVGAMSGPAPTFPNLTNTTAIGAFASVTESNAMILGGTGTSAVSVGIGTASPYTDYGLTVNTGGQNGIINGGVVVNATGGNLYLGMTGGAHKFRVDTNGVAYADGGYQSSGADFAESVAVRGNRSRYEPGDVLEIDQKANRHLALSNHPYATLVAGIYSTKPGLLATPHSIDDSNFKASEVPLAVVGIVPCKVTAENGAINRGDLLVTSSTAGYAMKGTDRRRLVGAVVGKALEPLPKGKSKGVIEILVTLQ